MLECIVFIVCIIALIILSVGIASVIIELFKDWSK